MGQPQRPHTRRVERDVMRAVWRHLGHSILMELLAIGATSFLQAFRAGASEGAEDVPVLRDKAAGIRAAAPVAAGIALTGKTVRHRSHLLSGRRRCGYDKDCHDTHLLPSRRM